MAITYGVIETAKVEGRMEGKAEGKAETVINAYNANIPFETICTITGLNREEVVLILNQKGLNPKINL